MKSSIDSEVNLSLDASNTTMAHSSLLMKKTKLNSYSMQTESMHSIHCAKKIPAKSLKTISQF